MYHQKGGFIYYYFWHFLKKFGNTWSQTGDYHKSLKPPGNTDVVHSWKNKQTRSKIKAIKVNFQFDYLGFDRKEQAFIQSYEL